MTEERPARAKQLRGGLRRPPSMRWSLLAAVPVLLGLSGCHSTLNDALASYTAARYSTAAAQFRAAEPEARELDLRAFAGYALRRGLTHLALGDARAAARWLGCAKLNADRDPELFSAREHGALIAAWRSMGHMPGEPGFLVEQP